MKTFARLSCVCLLVLGCGTVDGEDTTGKTKTEGCPVAIGHYFAVGCGGADSGQGGLAPCQDDEGNRQVLSPECLVRYETLLDCYLTIGSVLECEKCSAEDAAVMACLPGA
jgi:hypothetical protein